MNVVYKNLPQHFKKKEKKKKKKKWNVDMGTFFGLKEFVIPR